MQRLRTTRLGVILGILVPLTIWAADVLLPHTFQSGGAIRASEVNANFEALRVAVNAKAEASAVVGSGTRLRRLGFRMSDGTTQVGGILSSGESVYFDTLQNRHCIVRPSSLYLDSVGKMRCFPLASGGDLSASQINVFTDAQCTTPLLQRLADRNPEARIADDCSGGGSGGGGTSTGSLTFWVATDFA